MSHVDYSMFLVFKNFLKISVHWSVSKRCHLCLQGGGGVGSASSVVQDSGFCTESSKKNSEPEDELWCLLELIQNKGTRLRLEVESLKDKYGRSRSLGELGAASPPAQLVQANHAYQALLHVSAKSVSLLIELVSCSLIF